MRTRATESAITSWRMIGFPSTTCTIGTFTQKETSGRASASCNIPVAFNCLGFDYLRILQERLPPFLDSLTGSRKPRLAIYNAGTDVLAGDKLGGLFLSADEVLT